MQTIELSRKEEKMEDRGGEITMLRQEMKAGIGELREEMREGFRDVRSEVKDVRSEINNVRSEVNSVRSEVKDIRKDVRTEIAEFRSEVGLRLDSVHSSISTLWASMVGGYVALIVALILTRS
jgi:chromosome segregation ATPase